MRPNERLEQIEAFSGVSFDNVSPEDAIWLVNRVRRLTETLEYIGADLQCTNYVRDRKALEDD